MNVKQLLKSLAVMAALSVGTAYAQVSVMLPANPGGGWDTTDNGQYTTKKKAEEKPKEHEKEKRK